MVMLSPKAIAILGSRSFIGTHLTRELQLRGYTVYPVNSETCNLLDRQMTIQFISSLPEECHVVFLATINKFVENSYSAMLKNLEMARNVAEAMATRKCGGLIFFSAVDVYGLKPPCPISEQTLPCPSNYYALSKLVSEHIVSALSTRQYPLTILRLPGVYGPGDTGRSLISKFSKLMRDGLPIRLADDGKFKRDYVHVLDLCSLVDFVIQNPLDGILNVASSESVTIMSLIELLQLHLGGIANIEHVGTDLDSAEDLVFDVSSLLNHYPDLRIRPVTECLGEYLSRHGEDQI